MLFKRSEVLRVDDKPSVEQEVERRRRALVPGDAAGAVLLAEFCVESKLEGTARELLLAVVAKTPEYAGARSTLEDLDFHLEDEEWIAPEVYYPAKGYVRFGKAWITEEEARVRRETARDRRTAKRMAKRTKRHARFVGRRARRHRAFFAAERSQRERADARVAELKDELERNASQIKRVARDLRATRTRITGLEALVRATRRVHERLQREELRCEDECSCGVHKKQIRAEVAWELAQENLRKARDEERALQNLKRSLPRDAVKLRRELSRAEKVLTEATEDEARAQRELDDIQAEARQADRKARSAEQHLSGDRPGN